MASESKKPNILSRVFLRFGSRRNKPAIALDSDQLEGSSTVGVEPSSSSPSPVHSVPGSLLLPASSSTPQCHDPQPPIRQFRSESEIADFSQSALMSVHHQGQHDPLQPPQRSLVLQPDDNPLGVHGTIPSFFSGASEFQMRDLHVNVNCAGEKSIDGWELLLEHTAPDALYNSGARYDAPKCDEDTRVEVTSEIMEWIEDRDAPQRLLCMTGAAGAGKSALQQTVAEKCGQGNILGSSFFFSASDPSRNTTKPVIPTIAYQLGRRNPALKRRIKNAVEDEPLIFFQSVQAQIVALIAEPLGHLRDKGINLNSLPHAILIDGLDECKGEDRQAELLTAIRRCLLADNLPFRIFIASRPEWAIRTALEPGGHLRELAYHIQLSDQYDASADMCRFLRRRFQDIGLRIGNSQWFTNDNVETLVRAASGQFIYVATVYKYISERRASPANRLNIVLTWTPHEGQRARPFEALDILYTNILLNAKHAYEAADTHHGRDFLSIIRAHHINMGGFLIYRTTHTPPVDVFSVDWLRLEAREEESLISDLRSLVTLKKDHNGGLRLCLYHKSLSDFLEEESRAKELFVPEARVYAHIAKCFMQHITECQLGLDSVPDGWEDLPLPEAPRLSLRIAVKLLPFFLISAAPLDDELATFTQNSGWHRIDKLLPLAYRAGWLLQIWESWIRDLRRFTDNLTVRKPEVATVISDFVEKWDHEFKEWDHEFTEWDIEFKE